MILKSLGARSACDSQKGSNDFQRKHITQHNFGSSPERSGKKEVCWKPSRPRFYRAPGAEERSEGPGTQNRKYATMVLQISGPWLDDCMKARGRHDADNDGSSHTSPPRERSGPSAGSWRSQSQGSPPRP